MRLLEQKHCFLVSDIFFSNTTMGFTKPTLTGELPDDIFRALAFIKPRPEVSYLNQRHSGTVQVVKKAGVYEGDALFSKKKNHVLAVKTADCLPLFFYSLKKDIVGVVHMGWRSAKAGIIENITFDLESFVVIAGVGLRLCCYEVGEEFLQYPSLKPFLVEKETKIYFDPVAFAKTALVNKGLDESNFFDLALCNFCMDKGFFSYRKTATKNRTLSFILKQS